MNYEIEEKKSLSHEIKGLIERKCEESKLIEYKVKIELNTELASGITAFANTVGGTIYIGVETGKNDDGQSNGIPEEIVGIVVPQGIDHYKGQIQNYLNDKTAPRIHGICIESEEIDGDKYILKITIPRSYNSPHIVQKAKDRSQFYYRTNVGKCPMDLPHIRSMFLESEEIEKKIRDFRIDRVMRICSGDTPVPLEKGDYFILHVVPLSFNTPRDRRNIKRLRDIFMYLIKDIVHPKDVKHKKEIYNLDGYICYMRTSSDCTDLYYQVFRDGRFEIVWADDLDYGGDLYVKGVDNLLNSTLNYLFRNYKKHFDACPLVILVSLANIEHLKLIGREIHNCPNPLLIPEMLVEDLDSHEEVKNEILDIIFQCYGHEKRN